MILPMSHDSSCWEVIEYAWWTDKQKICQIITDITGFAICTSFCFSVGFGVVWMFTGRSPRNMEGNDIASSISLALFLGLPLLLILAFICDEIIKGIKWMREYYIRKKRELGETKAKRDVDLMA